MNASDRRRPAASAAWESLAAWLLCAAAVLAPVALGGTWVWGRLALELTMAAAVVAWALSARRPLPLVLLPLGIAGVVLLQLVPLPDRMLTFLAPVSAGAWKVALQGLTPAWGSISIDPGTTAIGMRRLLLGLATVAALADLGHQVPLRRRLTWSIAMSAAVIWCLGFAFPANKQHRVMLGFIDLNGPIKYWKTPIEEPLQTSGFGHPDQVTVAGMTYQADGWAIGDVFGSYICSNHFAGAMCLTLPVALAAWLSLSAARHAALRFAVAAAVLAAGVWTTGSVAGSRAGAAALVVAGIAVAALAAPRRWQRRLAGVTAMVIAGTVAAGLVFLIAFDSPPGFEERFPGPLQRHVRDLLQDGRIEAARAAVRMFRASPLLGTGLNSFGELLPRFMPRRPPLFFAHNDWAQLLAETGLAGAGIAAALAWALGRRFRAFLRRPLTPARVLDGGAWAALAGIGFHSLFDWNLHVPANGFLACLAAGLAASSTPEDGSTAKASRSGLPAGFALAAACLAAVAFLARDACSTAACRTVATAVAAARLAEQQGTPAAAADQLRAALVTGERIARWDPGNARLATLMGQAALHASADAVMPAADGERWFRIARGKSAAARGVGEVNPAK
jgi:O-antigen ligase